MARRPWRACMPPAAARSPRPRRPPWSGACLASWSLPRVRTGSCRCRRSPAACGSSCPDMPLVRRPSPPTEVAAAPASLTEGTSDQRWAAVRAVAERPDGVPLLAAALPLESDPRVREAIFTGLARAPTAESVEAVIPYLRSDDASLRTAAIDALRAMPEATRPYVAGLLADPEADVRLLSCEFARTLPESEANRLL